MSMLLDIGRAAIVCNLGFLAVLSYVWGRNYLNHGATHTLALLIFAGFLTVQNVVWGYLYVLHGDYVSWFANADPDLQMLLMALCLLETAALAAMTWITWK